MPRSWGISSCKNAADPHGLCNRIGKSTTLAALSTTAPHSASTSDHRGPIEFSPSTSVLVIHARIGVDTRATDCREAHCARPRRDIPWRESRSGDHGSALELCTPGTCAYRRSRHNANQRSNGSSPVSARYPPHSFSTRCQRPRHHLARPVHIRTTTCAPSNPDHTPHIADLILKGDLDAQGSLEIAAPRQQTFACSVHLFKEGAASTSTSMRRADSDSRPSRSKITSVGALPTTGLPRTRLRLRSTRPRIGYTDVWVSRPETPLVLPIIRCILSSPVQVTSFMLSGRVPPQSVAGSAASTGATPATRSGPLPVDGYAGIRLDACSIHLVRGSSQSSVARTFSMCPFKRDGILTAHGGQLGPRAPGHPAQSRSCSVFELGTSVARLETAGYPGETGGDPAPPQARLPLRRQSLASDCWPKRREADGKGRKTVLDASALLAYLQRPETRRSAHATSECAWCSLRPSPLVPGRC